MISEPQLFVDFHRSVRLLSFEYPRVVVQLLEEGVAGAIKLGQGEGLSGHESWPRSTGVAARLGPR